MRRYRRKLKLLAAAALALGLSGCQFLWGDDYARHDRHASSPLVNFLYADGAVPRADAPAVLQLPIRVGVSFMPDERGGDAPTAIDRDKVLNAIRENFRSLRYVDDIVIVPNYYLHARAGDGLAQIEQLSRLYKLDLFALVSYDQVVDSSFNKNSLAYITIVGAYFVRGDRHETHTLLDLAVIDPMSRSLVLRAGGTSALAGNTTGIDAARHQSAQRTRGFELATDELIGNFKHELTDFETRVREGHAPVKVVQSASPGGGGACDPLLLATLAACMALALARGVWPLLLGNGA